MLFIFLYDIITYIKALFKLRGVSVFENAIEFRFLGKNRFLVTFLSGRKRILTISEKHEQLFLIKTVAQNKE